MKYLLLTGATGLVGRYLLHDLLAAGVPVAVAARSNRLASAAHRVESVMAYWESHAGRPLPRPVVLEMDLRQPQLGLREEHRHWVALHCDRILHSAASMTFREDKHGEPFRTNVDGMRCMLALCKETGIRKFHHISTAYICGLRSGRVLETEVDLGQQNGNVYEASKLAAEKLVRGADFLDETTIYRPASVVGDSTTGFTTSSHGFYLPLQLAFVIAGKIPPELMGERFLKLLGLVGDEGKNLVPVNWLSAAIVYLVTHAEHHGRTYHLTNPYPVTVRLIQQVVREAIERHCPNRFVGTPSEVELIAYEQQFKDYMGIYRSHWRDDPIFDRTNTEAALPHLLCPELDHERMYRVASYPIGRKFVLNWPEPPEIGFSAGQHLQKLVRSPAEADGAVETVGVEVSGSGGGQWQVTLCHGEVVRVDPGISSSDRACYYLSSRTFSALVARRDSVEDSLRTGRVVIERNGNRGPKDDVNILKQIVSPARDPNRAAAASGVLAAARMTD